APGLLSKDQRRHTFPGDQPRRFHDRRQTAAGGVGNSTSALSCSNSLFYSLPNVAPLTGSAAGPFANGAAVGTAASLSSAAFTMPSGSGFRPKLQYSRSCSSPVRFFFTFTLRVSMRL